MDTARDSSTIGVYDNLDKAKNAIDELRNAGFAPNEIGIIGHVENDTKVATPNQLHAPEENAINGMVQGAFIGGVVGAFVVLVAPRLGELAGVGSWFDIVAGAVIGACACGVMVAFGSFIFRRPKSRYYAQALEKGHFLVTVRNPERQEEAASVLRHEGAQVDRGPR